MLRALRAARNVCEEMRRAARICADGRSFLRLSSDLVRYRARSALGRGFHNGERVLRLRDGVTITYRFNKGDIWSVREVWLFECYRLPFAIAIGNVLDLGANIGLTSLWLAKRYGCERIIAVEPSAANARLARRNLADNAVPAELIEAAVGPADGTAWFDDDEASNQGRLAGAGRAVAVVSVPTLLQRWPVGTRVDLVKLDIEGGEQALLTGDVQWLDRVRALIVEFHPAVVDYPGLIARLQEAGFRYVAKETVFPDNMDAFLKPDAAG